MADDSGQSQSACDNSLQPDHIDATEHPNQNDSETSTDIIHIISDINEPTNRNAVRTTQQRQTLGVPKYVEDADDDAVLVENDILSADEIRTDTGCVFM